MNVTTGQYIDVDGVNTYYIDIGDGKTIVLMHGAAPTSDAYGAWHHQIEALSARFRIVAFDQIGFGRTDLPPGGYFNRDQRVAHAIGFLRAMNIEDAVLVGHSEGGYMVTRIAIVAPELCSHLVIVTSGGTAPMLGSLDESWVKAAAAAYDVSHLDSEDAYVANRRHLTYNFDPEEQSYLRESYQRALAVGRVEIWQTKRPPEETDMTIYARLQEEHIFPYLKDLETPVLLIWATEDKTVPIERGLALLERIPHAEMHVFSQASHTVMQDRADGFNRLLSGYAQI